MTSRQGIAGDGSGGARRGAPRPRATPPPARRAEAPAARPAAPAGRSVPIGVRRTTTVLSRPPGVRPPNGSRAANASRSRPPRRAQTGSVRLANPGTRLRAGLFGVAFLLSLFAGRLLQLQGVDASDYAMVADSERRTEYALSASRGMITDRHGVPLAVSIDAVNVFADQTLVKNPALSARMLAPYVDVDVAELEADLQGDSRFKYLAKDLDQATWAKIEALNLPGIYDEVVPRRSYPGDTLAANVVGFVGADGVGLAGIEQMYDERLQGTDGKTSYLRDGSGRRIPSGASSETDPIPGQNIRLTIDQDLQWFAQNEIAAKVEESGAAAGNVVVMTPEGKILAMATAPTFNPNAVGSTDPSLLGNRVVEQAYEPGSIEKALTAAAVIEEGLATPLTAYDVPDRIVIDGEDYNDSHGHPAERITFANVIAQSSNVGTLLAADPMSSETLNGYLHDFGLGEPTGLGIPGESPGLITDPADWYESTRHTISFGQGLSVNSVQVASVYATLANGGIRVEPTLVEGFVDGNGDFEPAAAPEQRRVVSESTADQVTQMLEMVINDGTGKVAAIDGYKVAGKTGTAQFSNPSCGGCYSGFTASFAGYAPADNPQLIVGVTLQQPVNGYYGGPLGGPVFKNVMSYGLQLLEIPPTGAPLTELPMYPSEAAATDPATGPTTNP